MILPSLPREPGIYTDMSADEYHAIKAVSASGLVEYRRSPAHFAHSIAQGGKAPTKAMNGGTLFHCLTLEPDCFESRYLISDADGRSTRGKEDKKKAERTGKIPVKSIEVQNALCMAESAWENDAIAELWDMPGILFEAVILWEETHGGVLMPCKAKIDILAPAILADAKQAQDASPRAMDSVMYKLRYYARMAWYWRALRQAGREPDIALLIPVEPDPPHVCQPYQISSEALALGNRENEEDLLAMSANIEAGVWPGYGTELKTLDLPDWAYKAKE